MNDRAGDRNDARTQHLQTILRTLSKRSVLRKKRCAAVSRLILETNWSDDQCTLLSEALAKFVATVLKARKPNRVVWRWFGRSMVVNLIFWLSCYAMFPDGYTSEGVLDFWLGMIVLATILTGITSFITAPVSVWIDNRRLRNLQPILQALGHVGQPASIAPLATAFLHRPLSEAAGPVLISVAARLRPDDYGALPVQSVPALCRALLQADCQTGLAILQALAVVGDGRAIKSVEQIARLPRNTPLQEAATKLLPILQQRAIESQAASMLLRASDVSATGERTLLRATSEPNTPHEELLRMSQGEPP